MADLPSIAFRDVLPADAGWDREPEEQASGSGHSAEAIARTLEEREGQLAHRSAQLTTVIAERDHYQKRCHDLKEALKELFDAVITQGQEIEALREKLEKGEAI